MVLTVEEKLKRLNDWADWEICSPEHKTFLTEIANNVGPEVACHRAFPHHKNPAWYAGRLLQLKIIARGFEVINYVRPNKVYTKVEALEELTSRLRKNGLEDETYIKMLTVLSKMNGWDKPKDLPPSDEDKEENVNQAVVEAEKKIREEG